MTTSIRSFGASAGVSEISVDAAAEALEAGDVLVFSGHAFVLSAQTLPLIAAAVARSKNVSFDVNAGRLKGLRPTDAAHSVLRDAMSSFAEFSRQTVVRLLPHYEGSLAMGRTSFRPAEIAGRPTSWRKDDTRLHVDSFPSTPVHGRRILRFFSNVNPDGKGRHWRVGEPLPRVAPRFLSRLHPPFPGAAVFLEAMGLTKTRRSLYDHYMLQLHDAMKRDADFQAHTVQAEFRFPAGSSWLAYTDMVPHAAMSGQHAFEQTFYLPVERMHDASKSPQRLLESLLGRSLA